MIKIAENERFGDQITQKILFTIGIAKNQEELELLEKVAKDKIIEILNDRYLALPGLETSVHGTPAKEEPVLNMGSISEVKRINTGMEDVFGEIYSQMDFEDLIKGTRKDIEWNDTLKQVVLAQLFNPDSKRKTSNEVLKDLDKEIPLEKIYRMMDHLVPLETEIKQKIFQSSMSLLDYEVDVLFFDVTTLYFESFDSDELRDFGFSKDCKFKETQIVLALVTNNQGVPLTYEIFPGNKCEGATLIEIIKKIKTNYSIKNVVMVADRAMFNKTPIERKNQAALPKLV